MAQFKLCAQATAVKGALCGGVWRMCGPECAKKVENLLSEHSSKYDPTREEHEVILSFEQNKSFKFLVKKVVEDQDRKGVVLQCKNLPKFWVVVQALYKHEFIIEAEQTNDKKKLKMFILDRDGEEVVKPYMETKSLSMSELKSNVVKKIRHSFTNAPRLYTGVGM